MYLDELIDYCERKPGVTQGFPFDKDTLVLKVGGKMFLLTSLSDWEQGKPSLNLKCDPDRALELRAAYDQIVPGYHMNKTHWNTVSVNGMPAKLLLELINHSYELIILGLTKKAQAGIRNT